MCSVFSIRKLYSPPKPFQRQRNHMLITHTMASFTMIHRKRRIKHQNNRKPKPLSDQNQNQRPSHWRRTWIKYSNWFDGMQKMKYNVWLSTKASQSQNGSRWNWSKNDIHYFWFNTMKPELSCERSNAKWLLKATAKKNPPNENLS